MSTKTKTAVLERPKTEGYQKPTIKRVVFKKKDRQLGMCKRCGCGTGSSSGG